MVHLRVSMMLFECKTTVTHIDRRYNVSVDVINYTPVTLDELIAQNDVK